MFQIKVGWFQKWHNLTWLISFFCKRMRTEHTKIQLIFLNGITHVFLPISILRNILYQKVLTYDITKIKNSWDILSDTLRDTNKLLTLLILYLNTFWRRTLWKIDICKKKIYVPRPLSYIFHISSTHAPTKKN